MSTLEKIVKIKREKINLLKSSNNFADHFITNNTKQGTPHRNNTAHEASGPNSGSTRQIRRTPMPTYFHNTL